MIENKVTLNFPVEIRDKKLDCGFFKNYNFEN